jgi:hypothetical protein
MSDAINSILTDAGARDDIKIEQTLFYDAVPDGGWFN